MREVIFKELTSINQRKKNIFLKEVFEKNGVVAKTERRSFYFIKDVGPVGDEKELKSWLDAKKTCGFLNKRHFHILKEHNDSHGEDRIMCKIAGTFYAIVNKKLYTIAFMNSFKVSFVKVTV